MIYKTTMKKSDAKEIARKTLLQAIGTAYYKIADSNDYNIDESEMIIEEINKLGERMAKAIKSEYIAY